MFVALLVTRVQLSKEVAAILPVSRSPSQHATAEWRVSKKHRRHDRVSKPLQIVKEWDGDGTPEWQRVGEAEGT